MRHLLLTLLLLTPTLLWGQSIQRTPADFYEKHLKAERRAAPLPPLREDDVIWEHHIWRTINLQKKFNQYFYYPLDRKGVHGRKNFAYMLWEAVEEGRIPIYADDECLIPLDNDAFVERFSRPDTLVIEIQDEEDDLLVEYRTVLVPREFTSEDVLQVRLKEAWYIEKQTTDLNVRILSLALTQDLYKEIDGDRDFLGTVTLFWVPMLSPAVRDLFVQKEVYYDHNLAHLPSWDEVFHERYFDSYITRESNRFNRSLTSYLTGEDALLEAERIEHYLFEMASDMWEW